MREAAVECVRQRAKMGGRAGEETGYGSIVICDITICDVVVCDIVICDNCKMCYCNCNMNGCITMCDIVTCGIVICDSAIRDIVIRDIMTAGISMRQREPWSSLAMPI